MPLKTLLKSHLDSPSLPGLLSEEQCRYAGHEAAQKAAEKSALAQRLTVLVDLAGGTTPTEHAWEK